MNIAHLYRLIDGFLYVDNFGNIVRVIIGKDTIELIENGRAVKTFILERTVTGII